MKEMDVIWWDDRRNTLWLIECKGDKVLEKIDSLEIGRCFGQRTGFFSGNSAELIHELLVKAVDCLMMLSSAWAGTDRGSSFLREMPETVRQALRRHPGEGNIALMFVINARRGRESFMGAIGDKLNHLLAGKLALFGIRRAEVVDIEGAYLHLQKHGSRLRIRSAAGGS